MPNPTGCNEVSCGTTARHSVTACLYVRLPLIIHTTKTKKNQGGCGSFYSNPPRHGGQGVIGWSSYTGQPACLHLDQIPCCLFDSKLYNIPHTISFLKCRHAEANRMLFVPWYHVYWEHVMKMNNNAIIAAGRVKGTFVWRKREN
jgi:hypothetical protein